MWKTLFAIVSLAIAPPYITTTATLTFQRPTDVLGVASTFEEGTRLPTRNFTVSTTARSSSGRNAWFIQRTGTLFYIAWYPSSSDLIYVTFDSTSYVFELIPPAANVSIEDAIMAARMWTITYNDATGELSIYMGMIHIGSKSIAPIFPGLSIFSPAAIPYLSLGPYTSLSYDQEGSLVLSLPSDIDGLFGSLDSLHIWDRALNASEVAQVAAYPVSLTGDEEGLCVFWRADLGHGTRLPNLGSAGSTYDAVLGQFAVGIGQTSSIFGSGCDTVSATPPTWVNKTGGNMRPTAENVTLQVSYGCGCATPLTLNDRSSYFPTHVCTGSGVDNRRASDCDSVLSGT